jgi:death-on-curing protein
LWESLSQNHPFVDGNKRIAITATAAFLRMNGYMLIFDDLEAYRYVIGLYENRRMNFTELEAWLRAHALALTDR